MASYKYMRHTVEEVDEAIDSEREHCASTDTHTCKEEKVAWNTATQQASAAAVTLGYKKRNFFQHARNTQTLGGITFTVNSDRSFTVNGTATQLVSFMMTNFQTIPQGKYLCSGCSGGSSSTYYLRLETSRSADQTVSGNVLRQSDGEDVPITVDGDYDSIKVNIVVQKGVTVDNVKIAPMIRADYDTDPTYEPYKPSVVDQLAEILERLTALEGAAVTTEGGTE